MKKILLTEAQHELLKRVLDHACEEVEPDVHPLRELWHACARATNEEPGHEPPVSGGCAPQVL